MIRNRSCFQGNTLSEYGLIAALCLLGVLPGLLLLGDTVKGLFPSMLPAPSQAQITSASAPSASIPFIAEATSGLDTFSPDISIDMKSVLTQPLSETVQTAGVNGASRALSDALIVMAEQALKEGKITAQQRAGLVQLANQGHKLAKIERIIEGAAKANPNSTNFFNTQVSYNGKNVTVKDLWMKIGYDLNKTDSEPNVLNPEFQPYSETNEFITLYQEMNHSGALDDPTLKRLVTGIANKILKLNNAMDVSLRFYWGYDLNDVSDLQQKNTSVLTDTHSARLCESGDAKDSGTYCAAVTGG